MSKITLEDVILEMQPFSKELVNWCKTHNIFFKALKNIYPDKFLSLAVVMITKSLGDEIIGVYTYDYKINKPIFKQDFIVNTEAKNKKFILYTRNPKGSSKYVKDINDFFDRYKNYKKSDHHLTIDELPTEIKFRANRAIELSKNIDLKNISQAHIEKIYKEVMAIKREKRIEYIKLNFPKGL